MKIHIVLQALSRLQAQKERLRIYAEIGKQERGKLAAGRKCISGDTVCGNMVCASESRGIVPEKP